jgi:hypothetical protein
VAGHAGVGVAGYWHGCSLCEEEVCSEFRVEDGSEEGVQSELTTSIQDSTHHRDCHNVPLSMYCTRLLSARVLSGTRGYRWPLPWVGLASSGAQQPDQVIPNSLGVIGPAHLAVVFFPFLAQSTHSVRQPALLSRMRPSRKAKCQIISRKQPAPILRDMKGNDANT